MEYSVLPYFSKEDKMLIKIRSYHPLTKTLTLIAFETEHYREYESHIIVNSPTNQLMGFCISNIPHVDFIIDRGNIAIFSSDTTSFSVEEV